MHKSNPLRIFSEEEIKSLNESNLFQYKSQKLLLFQMAENYTVKFNEYILDKNSVLRIFEELEGSLDKFLLVYNVPVFYAFLSSLNLSGIGRLSTVDLSDFSKENRGYLLDSVRDKICNQLGHDIIHGNINPVSVKLVVDFIEKHYPINFYECFEKVFKELESYLIKIEELFLDPLNDLHRSKLEFKCQVTQLLNGSFYSSLNKLPSSMTSIKVSYALICQKLLKYVLIRGYVKPRNYKKSTLYTLREAMYIVLDNFKDDFHEVNVRIVTNYLSGISKNDEDALDRWIVLLIMLFLGIIFYLFR